MEVILRQFSTQGFAAVDGQVMRDTLKAFGATEADLDEHAEMWNALGDDPVYDFRKTSQTRWNLDEGFETWKRLERSPFRIPAKKEADGTVTLENAELGKLERWFPEAKDAFLDSTVHHACMRFMRFFLKEKTRMEESSGKTTEGLGYISGSHQFRIEFKAASAEEEEKRNKEREGKTTFDHSPTPEGVHQDGAAVVMIMYVNSGNMGRRSGESRVYSKDQKNGVMTADQSAVARKETRIVERNLATPFECFLLNDRDVKHDNKPIFPKDTTQYSFRDVHVIWVREFNEADLNDPRKEHPTKKVEVKVVGEDVQYANLERASSRNLTGGYGM